MHDATTYRRTAVAVSLLAAPMLALVSVALHPPYAPVAADRLADLDRAGAGAWLSNLAFTAAQVPMLVAYLGIAHLLGRRAPRLSSVGATLGVLATFGEAVMGGASLVWLTMAGDAANRTVFATVWERFESSPAMLFGVVGFGGTVLTIVLLSIGLFRARVVPRWIPALLWGFLVLELVGSGLSEFAGYAGVLCLLLAYGALARHVWRAPREEEAGPAEAPAAPTPGLSRPERSQHGTVG